jgi:ABC-type transport system involved in multi-copper enzyme maturation permease subunit
LGILWTVLSFNIFINSPGNQEMIAIMSTFQVALGLLLLSVGAATSLAEERVRGSLDVLLCTPLSTQSILVGKWWGSFLRAAQVLAWPTILSGILVIQSGRWISYLILLGLISAYCAVITSLGLVVATWVSRLGRAVALTVSTYVLFSIGWIVLPLLVAIPFGSNGSFLVLLVMGSPLYGTPVATMAVAPGALQLPGGPNSTAVTLGALMWILAHGAGALLLFQAALASFDTCLGRVSEVTARSIPFAGKEPDAELNPDLHDWLAKPSPEIWG